MLTSEDIKEIDKFELSVRYSKWPKHFQKATEMEVQTPDASDINNIIIAGVGGSGTTADILSDWLRYTKDTPIHAVKDYHLPRFASRDTLVVALSYSGETEETLNIIYEAITRKCRIAVISSGGLAERVCRKLNLSYTKIMGGMPSRAGLPFLFCSAALVLEESGIVNDVRDQLRDIYKVMDELGDTLLPEVQLEQNPSKRLAVWLRGSLPIIYASHLSRSAALRFKDALNENAKLHAIADVLPEICHNDLVAWGHSMDIPRRAIFLRFQDELPEVRERFKAVREWIEESGSSVYEVYPSGFGYLERILSMIYLLDFASIYLAILRGIDPTPIIGISTVKKKLNERLRYLERYTDLPL